MRRVLKYIYFNRFNKGLLVSFSKVFFLLIVSGRPTWPMAWAYIFIGSFFLLYCHFFILRKDKPFLEERKYIRDDAETWDKVVDSLLDWLTIAMVFVASLDMRFGWTPEFPLWLSSGAAVLSFAAICVILWGTAVNRYWAALVRIQDDRGHQVITDGPFAYVRHPGNLASNVFNLCAPLILSSLWAFIPAICIVVTFIVRVIREDNFLRENLKGYEEYAQKVKYRLVPYVF